MDKYFYFFDLNEILIDRYPAKISTYLYENYDTVKFVFIFSEEYEKGIPVNLPKGSKYFYIPSLSRKKIENILTQYPPNSLTTIAQRIPDMLLFSIFNSKDLPTFIVQHGLWADQLVRIALGSLFISKFKKFVRFVNYTKSICKINGLPFFSVLSELYKFSFKENIYIPNTKHLNIDSLRAKTVFSFDETWNDYYKNKYGYTENQLVHIGNPDFMVLNDGLHTKKQEDAVCYICQTLIEDGRYLSASFYEFLDVLKSEVLGRKKLYIKLHPRSRMKYYKTLEFNSNVVFTHDFPKCEYYIGHYSGMLAVAHQESENVFIWNLKDHHMPEYYNQFASYIGNSREELRLFISGKLKDKYLPNKVSRKSPQELSKLNPIKKIGDIIVKQIKENTNE